MNSMEVNYGDFSNSIEVNALQDITDIKLTPELIKKHLTKYYKEKELKKARNRRYSQSANGKKVKAELAKKYREQNKEQIAERAKQRYAENKEKIAQKRREKRLQKKREKWDQEDKDMSEWLEVYIGGNKTSRKMVIKKIRKILDRPRE